MNPDQGDNFWKEAESQGTMPQADNVISGEVQPTQEIPLGASHFAMFPQTTCSFSGACRGSFSLGSTPAASCLASSRNSPGQK